MTIPEDVCRKTEVASEESICKTEPAQVEEESEMEEVVEEVIIPRSPKMDTAGKPIGRPLKKRINQIIPATTKRKISVQYISHEGLNFNTHRACCMFTHQLRSMVPASWI
jgi:hypothetical protein